MAETRLFRSLICGKTDRIKGGKHEWKYAETAYHVTPVSPSRRRTRDTFYMLPSDSEPNHKSKFIRVKESKFHFELKNQA